MLIVDWNYKQAGRAEEDKDADNTIGWNNFYLSILPNVWGLFHLGCLTYQGAKIFLDCSYHETKFPWNPKLDWNWIKRNIRLKVIEKGSQCPNRKGIEKCKLKNSNREGI